MRENRPYGLEGGESGSTGLPYPYPKQPGSLREIHYLCVFAPLRLCVYFFETAGISAGDPLTLRLCVYFS